MASEHYCCRIEGTYGCRLIHPCPAVRLGRCQSMVVVNTGGSLRFPEKEKTTKIPEPDFLNILDHLKVVRKSHLGLRSYVVSSILNHT